MTESTVLLERTGGIRRLTLNRPDKLNSFTRAMLSELGDALSDIAGDDEARVLVVTGAGRAFSAGQDLREAEAIEDGAAVRAVVERLYNPVVRQLRSLQIPVLAAVNGIAAGAGASLAVACDLVIAAESASFVQAFAKIGLVPDAGASYLVPRLIGQARALGLALLAEPIDARTAESWGLIWKAVPDAAFAETVEATAARLSQSPTAAIALMKQALNASGHHSLEQQLALEAELQARAAETEDFQEGVRSFLEKRAPRFIGR
ncbi:MAG TPA: enoyl-CoA hydratase-related protein [Candidatus Binatia bacterium]|nr:enoyl-CoA hydratase-related protein [Candidatus Binatia bacterium]